MRHTRVTFPNEGCDRAFAWFSDALGFVLLEDSDMGGSKRWVRMAPHAEAETGFLIARATGDQSDFIGRQVGGRVGHILFTEDLAAQKARMQAAGVQFREDLRHEAYGVVAVFEDLHGALWDLIQPV